MLHYLQSGGMFEAENLNACSALIALREWESGLRLATRWRNLKTFFFSSSVDICDTLFICFNFLLQI